MSCSLALLAAYAAMGCWVAHRMTTPRRVKPPEDTAWSGIAPILALRLTPRGGELPLAATYVPAGNATRADRGAVLFVHGMNGCRGHEVRISTEPLVRALSERGYAILLLDLRGHGDSAAARMTFGVDEADDVLGAIDWLRAAGYAPQRIGVFAASMGAASVLRAARSESAIGPLVLDSAYADFAAMIRLRFRKLTGLPLCFLPVALWASRRLTGTDFRAIRPVEDAQRVGSRPVLVIHAKDDPFVPVEHAQRLASATCAATWISGGRHHLATFRDETDVYVERVAGFFDRHLGLGVSEDDGGLVDEDEEAQSRSRHMRSERPPMRSVRAALH